LLHRREPQSRRINQRQPPVASAPRTNGYGQTHTETLCFDTVSNTQHHLASSKVTSAGEMTLETKH
jgi:hypothetical protein